MGLIMGMGTGSQIETHAKPIPMAWVWVFAGLGMGCLWVLAGMCLLQVTHGLPSKNQFNVIENEEQYLIGLRTVIWHAHLILTCI